MLPRRADTVRVWLVGAPRLEQRLVPVAYPVIAALVRRNLGLRSDTIQRERALIDASVGRIDERLQDGATCSGTGSRRPTSRLPRSSPRRCYRTATAVLLPTLDELPERMRLDVHEIRATAAGELAQRLYREERPRRA